MIQNDDEFLIKPQYLNDKFDAKIELWYELASTKSR